jgi:hypothetical protein
LTRPILGIGDYEAKYHVIYRARPLPAAFVLNPSAPSSSRKARNSDAIDAETVIVLSAVEPLA